MCKTLEEKNIDPASLEGYFKDYQVDEETDNANDVTQVFFKY